MDAMKRMTRQRKAILECFKKYDRPLSIEEILENVIICIPELNLSTVYRNIKILLEERIIHHIDLPGLCSRYELAKDTHHHHFLCQMCDRLYDILGCPSGISSLIPEGFTMVSHSLTLTGYCAACVSDCTSGATEATNSTRLRKK